MGPRLRWLLPAYLGQIAVQRGARQARQPSLPVSVSACRSALVQRLDVDVALAQLAGHDAPLVLIRDAYGMPTPALVSAFVDVAVMTRQITATVPLKLSRRQVIGPRISSPAPPLRAFPAFSSPPCCGQIWHLLSAAPRTGWSSAVSCMRAGLFHPAVTKLGTITRRYDPLLCRLVVGRRCAGQHEAHDGAGVADGTHCQCAVR
jgi:hypothetical protein